LKGSKKKKSLDKEEDKQNVNTSIGKTYNFIWLLGLPFEKQINFLDLVIDDIYTIKKVKALAKNFKV
jgi:hypothetical protein